MRDGVDRLELHQDKRAKPHPKRDEFWAMPGAADADSVRDTFVRVAGRGPSSMAIALSRADGTTRARIVGRLGQEHGNFYLQRLVGELRTVPSPSLRSTEGDTEPIRTLDSLLPGPTDSADPVLRPAASLNAPTIQRKKKSPGEAKALAPEAERALAERIVAAIHTGGITVAVYPAASVKSAAEFKRQANQFAADHRAIGIQGSSVREGVSMELTASLPSTLQSLSQGIDRLLQKYPELTGYQSLVVPIQTLAIFTHGGKTQLQAGAHGEWIKKSLIPWVEAITPYLSQSPRVLLYACSTAGKPAKGMPFAEAMREALQASLRRRYGEEAEVAPEVWGHTTAGHTTANRFLVQFSGGDVSDAGTDLLKVLGGRLAALAIRQAGREGALTGAQVEQVTKNGRSAMTRVLKAKTGRKDPTNAYNREIPQMGIDRVWHDVSMEASPDLADLGLTEDALSRVAAGLLIFQTRFQKEREKLEKQVHKLSAS